MTAIVVVLAGCSSSSPAPRDAAMDPVPGDVTTGDDGKPEVGGPDSADTGGADANTHCIEASFGCRCSPGDDGTLQACSVASVSAGGANGYCCQSDYECQCARVECHTRTADAYCICTGPTVAPIEGTLGPSCDALQASNPSIVCCLNSTACVCSTQPCSFVGQQVPSCSPAPIAAATCNGTQMVDTCR